MKRLRYVVMLVMLTGTMMLPAGMMQASAQGEDLCAGALAHGEGEYAGFEVVYHTGGAGSQIVLGSDEGGSYLSGGSGNDVLCAWGSGNTLDGGSGNDLLIAPDGPLNTFLGGSGNDTMIGVQGDDFNGGSGRNEIVAAEPMLNPVMTFSITLFEADFCTVTLELTGFAPLTTYDIAYYAGPPSMPTVTTDVNGDGNLTYGAFIVVSDTQIEAAVPELGVSTGPVIVAC